ncbi:hypothetical protein Tco_0111413 [Tanacetum coccineum]
MTLINAEGLSNFVSLQCLSSLLNALLQNTMAERNVPTQPPTRTDEQIVPRSQWLTIGKSNLLFNAQKIQKNPIFQISVDILSNTNFFQAFTASANVPAIYLQQFWNTMKYNEKTGVYSCQVDEQWFELSADLLRKALAITPVIPAHPFELPPSGNIVIDFVNVLGYPEPVEIVSNIRVNYVYQLKSLLKGSRHFSHHRPSKSQSHLKNPKKKVTSFSSFLIYDIPSVYNGNSDPLITATFNNPRIIPKYIEMVAANTRENPSRKVQACKPATKHATTQKATTTTPVNESKPALLRQRKPSNKIFHSKLERKAYCQLVDEDDEAQHRIYPQDKDDTSEKVIHESSSTSDSERTESETDAAAPKGDKDQGEVDTSTVTSGVSIPVSDPEKAHEAWLD